MSLALDKNPLSLESFSVLFLQAKLGECFVLWFALTPPPLNWLTERKNPFEVSKLASRYNEFGYKSNYQKKILAKISLPKKIPKSKILNLKKSFDHPGHLKSGVPPPPRNSNYKKFSNLLVNVNLKNKDGAQTWFVYCKRVENTN